MRKLLALIAVVGVLGFMGGGAEAAAPNWRIKVLGPVELQGFGETIVAKVQIICPPPRPSTPGVIPPDGSYRDIRAFASQPNPDYPGAPGARGHGHVSNPPCTGKPEVTEVAFHADLSHYRYLPFWREAPIHLTLQLCGGALASNGPGNCDATLTTTAKVR